MIKIWRVENDEGIGCYCCHLPELEPLYKKHNRTYRKRPLPAMDKGIKRNLKRGEICGFLNESQALEWFTQNDLDILLAFDFRLREVEITKITAIGQRQVLAVR